jgi:hypothetical protein
MKKKATYGGFLLRFEPKRSEKILDILHRYEEASESFSAVDWKFEKRELAFLALNPNKTDLCAMVLMERMHQGGGTGKLKMRMSNPVFFDNPVSQAEISKKLVLRKMISSAEDLKRIIHMDWNRLIELIKVVRPSCADDIDSLVAKREALRQFFGDDNRTKRLMEQRDALGIALDIGGLDRKEILKSVNVSTVSKANSILDLLDNQPLHEQDLLRHDQNVFGKLLTDGMRAATFRNANGRSVRVHVYDKKPLETVLGVDLLIYQEGYQSFLLLQYKTMERISATGGKSWSYLVDKQIRDQITAMCVADARINEKQIETVSVKDWRLHRTPFYFKFCETTRPESRDDALISGITLSIDHLDNFLKLPESDGENGGKRIGYGNCPRYLNNTQFLDLASSGWIGCDSIGLELISSIIDAGQKEGKVAMYAVVNGSVPVSASARPGRKK